MADGTIVIDTSIDKKKIDSQVSSIKANVERGFKNIAKIAGAALATATAAVGAFAVSSVKDFIVFKDKMNEVFTLLPGASQEMKDSMIEDVKALSKEMGVLPTEVIPAVYQALSAGIPQGNVFDFVRIASKLATAGVAEMDDAVGVLSTVVNNYASTGLTAEEASNMLFTAVKDGVTTIPELATKLGDVVPIAASLGIGFDEVAGATGAMTAIMGKGSTMKAVTNLRGMLNELGKEGSAADMAFQKVAGVGFTAFIEKGGTLQEAMGVLKTASIENNTSINNLFGSIEAGQAALILAGDGAQKFAGILDDMGNSTGATDAAFKTMTESTQFSIDKIMANIAAMKLNLAQKLIPSFDSLLTSIMGIFDGTEGATQNFVDTLETTIGDLLDVIIPLIIDLAPKLIEGAGEIVMAIVDGISENTDQLSDATVEIIMSIVNFITDNLPEIIAVTLKLMLSIAQGIIKNIPEIISSLATMTAEMIKIFGDAFPDFMEAGKNMIIGLWQGIKDNAMKPINAIKDVAGNLLQKVKDIFKEKSPSKAMYEIGAYLDEGLANGITDSTPEVVQAGADLGTAVIEGVGGKLEEGATELEDKMVNSFSTWIGVANTAIGALSSAIEAFGADTVKKVGDTVAAVGKATGNAVVEVSGQILGLLGDVIDFFVSAKSRAADFARSIVSISQQAQTQILANKLKALDTEYAAETSIRDRALQDELERNGMAEQSTMQKLDAQLAQAIATGDAETQKQLEISIAKQAIIDKYAGLQLAADEKYMKAKAKIDHDKAVLDQKIAVTQAKIAESKAISDLGWFNRGKKDEVRGMYAELISAIQSYPIPSYAIGGVINRDQVANIHAGETILPRGITADMKSAGLMIQPLGRNGASSGNMYGIINLDGRELARAVFKHTDSNVGLAYTG